MLTVTLVATLASAALWQQWRSTEVEQAERQRVQASWILTGALDWARLLLREDARGNRNSGHADHLGEPWATPLEEAQLSSFLAADKHNNSNSADDLMPAFLSGEMVDAQSRLNALNLVRTTGSGAKTQVEVSPPDLAAFTKLYQLLDLPQSELDTLVSTLLSTSNLALNDPKPSPTPLTPARFAQLGWLGVGVEDRDVFSHGVFELLVGRQFRGCSRRRTTSPQRGKSRATSTIDVHAIAQGFLQ